MTLDVLGQQILESKISCERILGWSDNTGLRSHIIEAQQSRIFRMHSYHPQDMFRSLLPCVQGPIILPATGHKVLNPI